MAEYSINGTESLGVEFGSTRIKAVLVDSDCHPIAVGTYDWENKFENGFWTYDLSDVWTGLQSAYRDLSANVKDKFDAEIENLSSIGFSAMMHGYLPFDKDGNQLVPFRTWRNTTTQQAASKLTKLFHFNIPQRWSIAHLYQAIMDNESHINAIDYLTTLAGYVHWKLSGQKVLGVGEASGMFPIDSDICDYDSNMIAAFSSLDEVKVCKWNIRDILPKVIHAGENAGRLTDEGALLIDPTGKLKSGVLMCPPEGDAGTGMVATNSVRVKTGNVSAGTSIFSMTVLDTPLKKVYEEIDMVTTPAGKPVAMVHCNNCCTDLDYWVNLFIEFSALTGVELSKSEIYDLLYNAALDGEKDCGGLVNINYFSGEPITKLESGKPLFVRTENAEFNLSNFMRAQIYSAVSTLKIGMEILEHEGVKIDTLMGHGGLFKTKFVGQKFMADAMNTPVSVMDTAGEGGAWGIAILARYAADNSGLPLEDYLDRFIFNSYTSSTVKPDENDVIGFNKYIELYKKAIKIEKTAVEILGS